MIIQLEYARSEFESIFKGLFSKKPDRFHDHLFTYVGMLYHAFDAFFNCRNGITMHDRVLYMRKLTAAEDYLLMQISFLAIEFVRVWSVSMNAILGLDRSLRKSRCAGYKNPPWPIRDELLLLTQPPHTPDVIIKAIGLARSVDEFEQWAIECNSLRNGDQIADDPEVNASTGVFLPALTDLYRRSFPNKDCYQDLVAMDASWIISRATILDRVLNILRKEYSLELWGPDVAAKRLRARKQIDAQPEMKACFDRQTSEKVRWRMILSEMLKELSQSKQAEAA